MISHDTDCLEHFHNRCRFGRTALQDITVLTQRSKTNILSSDKELPAAALYHLEIEDTVYHHLTFLLPGWSNTRQSISTLDFSTSPTLVLTGNLA